MAEQYKQHVKDFNLLNCFTYHLKYIHNKTDFILHNGKFHYLNDNLFYSKYKLLYSTKTKIII